MQVKDIAAFSFWSIGYQTRSSSTLTIERVAARGPFTLGLYKPTPFHYYDLPLIEQ
jgi:hypothetical protein